MSARRVLIMGAAGRDFHNFNLCYRDNRAFEVVGFTATQIPNISGRRYPAPLAGSLYPDGIPIYEEDRIEELIRTQSVVSVCAVRTGAGKSQTTRRVCRKLLDQGRRVVAVRHPMPYGDLVKQRVQRFATFDDLDRHECTIEEREEYEPHLKNGTVVYAGVDYGAILQEAEGEADVIVWDGGNNDLPLYKPDVEIVVVDPHRPGHEIQYHPGEANFRRASCLIINKIDTADKKGIEDVKAN